MTGAAGPLLSGDARLDEWIRVHMARPQIRDLFGMELVSCTPGQVILALDRRPELGHMPGWFHGSVTTALAECAAGLSGGSLALDRDSMTLQQAIHFTGAARGDRLVAEGRVVSAGRRISTTAADVFVERDGQRHPCALMTMTMTHVEHRG